MCVWAGSDESVNTPIIKMPGTGWHHLCGEMNQLIMISLPFQTLTLLALIQCITKARCAHVALPLPNVVHLPDTTTAKFHLMLRGLFYKYFKIHCILSVEVLNMHYLKWTGGGDRKVVVSGSRNKWGYWRVKEGKGERQKESGKESNTNRV